MHGRQKDPDGWGPVGIELKQMCRTKEQNEAAMWMPRWPVGCESRQREAPVWSRKALRDIGAPELKDDSVRTAEKRIRDS
jgi:hypothetical protein